MHSGGFQYGLIVTCHDSEIRQDSFLCIYGTGYVHVNCGRQIGFTSGTNMVGKLVPDSKLLILLALSFKIWIERFRRRYIMVHVFVNACFLAQGDVQFARHHTYKIQEFVSLNYISVLSPTLTAFETPRRPPRIITLILIISVTLRQFLLDWLSFPVPYKPS